MVGFNRGKYLYPGCVRFLWKVGSDVVQGQDGGFSRVLHRTNQILES
jgi:hypothetical protein